MTFVLQKVKKALQLIGNMGWKYIFFRTAFEIKKRTGFLKKSFPIHPVFKSYYSLEQWRASAKPFFFESKEKLSFERNLSEDLKYCYKKLEDHIYPFFSNKDYKLGSNYDWVTNIESGFSYNKNLHWLDVNDYDKQAGDIKFVWEPSRFSHLYTVIRYDYHSGIDCSLKVFSEIEHWIASNNINQGPNFKCSQEISLRIMNWTFALYYFKNSPNLTPALFDKIQHYIYWQIEHVYQNINFSRIAVRNNHAITETLLLYLAGLLYPDYPNAKIWKQKGKAWFEEEIAYQIYEDGTFLQFSMNYHRVVIQLLTWAFKLSSLNNEQFKPVVYERAKLSLSFLLNAMDSQTGWLPNYGNNDGALFFKLGDTHYRNYMPQLEAFSYSLGLNVDFAKAEDANWYGLSPNKIVKSLKLELGCSRYDKGGYYIYRIEDSLSLIRCGNHKDRPAQADNLHLDIWYQGRNLLHDGGSYKYNSSSADLKYFMGTQSHNTIMLGENDQMEKGNRFIWYYWTQCERVMTSETDEAFIFEGTIKAFQQLDEGIRHTRKVKIFKHRPIWEITDHIANKPNGLALKQLWHSCYMADLQFIAINLSGEEVLPSIGQGFHSSFYGVKEACDELIFATLNDTLITTITIK